MTTNRRIVATVTATITTVGLCPLFAVAQAERIVFPDEHETYAQEFQQDPIIPPTVDGVGGLTDEEVV
ncbi:hypothetical protein GCM10027595_17640 [Corynebacterium nasicanis]